MGRMSLFLLFRGTLQMWVLFWRQPFSCCIFTSDHFPPFCSSNCRKDAVDTRIFPKRLDTDCLWTVPKDHQYPTTVYHVSSWCHLLYSEEMRVLSTSAALKPLSMESKFKLLLEFFIFRRILTDKFLNTNNNSRNKISFAFQRNLVRTLRKERKWRTLCNAHYPWGKS